MFSFEHTSSESEMNGVNYQFDGNTACAHVGMPGRGTAVTFTPSTALRDLLKKEALEAVGEKLVCTAE